jgi:MFS family permease
MDTTGAMLGPLLAFALLALAPLAFTSIFLVSFCLAILGVAILVLFVNGRARVPDAGLPEAAPSLRRAFSLLRMARFRAVLLVAGALSLATASDAFIFLALQEELDLGNSLFPLLFVGSAGTYMVLAAPLGRLADRFGRGRILLAGYAMLGAVYAALLLPMGGWVLLTATLGLLGAYYAATDGVLMALGSTVVPSDVRGSGLALLGTATSLGRLVASVAFGALWMVWGIDAAFACFAAALAIAAAVAAPTLARMARRSDD